MLLLRTLQVIVPPPTNATCGDCRKPSSPSLSAGPALEWRIPGHAHWLLSVDPRSFPSGRYPSIYPFCSLMSACPSPSGRLGTPRCNIDFPCRCGIIKPAAGRRRHQAMASASLTRLVCLWGCRLQPTTWRPNRSMTAARYSRTCRGAGSLPAQRSAGVELCH